MSTFRQQELGQRLLAQWQQDVPFSTMVEQTGYKVNKIRRLIAEAAGGVNEWRKMREAKHAQQARRAPVTSTASSVDLETIRGIVQSEIEAVFDAPAVRDMVQEEVKRFPPQSGKLEITLKQTSGKTTTKRTVIIDRSHAVLKDALRTIDAGFENLLLVGPAGSGKTTLAKQIAQALKARFGFISLSGGITEGALLGRLTADGTYLPSLFVDLFEKGGVFLLDEVDRADANVLLVLNAALDQGMLSLPARHKKPVAMRHPDFKLIAAGNTWGTGADMMYVGANQLDAAFLSRFAGAVLEVTYDETLERSLVMDAMGDDTWFVEFTRVRVAVSLNKLRRVVGTREMLAGVKLLKAGYARVDVWQRLTAGWTQNELDRVGLRRAA